jgi:NarL family two-component system response regulator LiaR
MAKLKVLIADDQSLVRQGLKTFLEMDPDIEVIGTAVNGVDAIRQTLSLKPDIVLMDILMPEMNGIEATLRIKREMPAMGVLVLTSVLERDTIFKALKAGANGYVLKDIHADELCQTIKGIGSGAISLSPDAFQQLTNAANSSERQNLLSEREIEVLRMIAQGKANKEIAHKLILSEGTIKTHVSVILAKLGFHTRTEAALYASHQGLL